MSFCAEEMRKLADAQSREEQLKASLELQIRKIAENGGYAARYSTNKLSRREVIMLSAWLTDLGFRVICANHDGTTRWVVWGDTPDFTERIYEIVIE